MPSMTIYVAAKGTVKSDSTVSKAGHMWYKIDDGAGNVNYYGFAQAEGDEGEPFGNGQVYEDDHLLYTQPSYSTQIPLSASQYDDVVAFSLAPSAHGFGADYNLFANNCISFVWEALEEAGLNPSGFEGGRFPEDNIKYLENLSTPPDEIRSEVPDGLKPALGVWERAPNANSPLILDLDGDGIEVTKLGFTSAASNVYFDLDNDGFTQRTAWVTGGDGLLAWDKNSNGVIDNQGELFGNSSTYADGFAYLDTLDTNSDNKITSADTGWSNLKVWIDADGDGQTHSGELRTLASLNITEISVNSTALTNTFINENEVTDTATFKIGGQTRTIADVWFRNDGVDTRSLDTTALSEEVYYLPTLRGFGQISDLHIVMSADTSLRDLVDDFSSTWSTEKFGDVEALNNEVRDILLAWGNVDGVSPTSRGPWVDGRELGFIERLFADTYLSPSSNTYPDTIGQGQIFDEVFAYVLENFKAQLIAQVAGNTLFSAIPAYSAFTGTIYGGSLSESALEAMGIEADAATNPQSYWSAFASTLNYMRDIRALTPTEIAALDDAVQVSLPTSSWAQIAATIVQIDAQYITTAFSDDLAGSSVGESISGGGGDDYIAGYAGGDYLNGEGGNDEIFGGYENDTLHGGDGNDLLDGGSQNDLIYGGNGNDLINGGAGTDSLYGDAGDDVFQFAPGFEADSLFDSSGTDRIEFLDGVTPGDVRLMKSNNDLTIYSGAETIWIPNQFYDLQNNTNNYGEIEAISFYDLSSIDLLGSLTFTGTNGSDLMQGTKNADILVGMGGYDSFQGELGNDTYVIGEEAGQAMITDTGGVDKVEFKADLAFDDLRFQRSNNDLIIHIDSDAIVYLQNHFYDLQNSTNNYNEIEFATFSNSPAVSLLNEFTFKGTASGEGVYGTKGSDTLIGLGGYDSLYGEDGDDTYVLDVGFEQEYIVDTGGTDSIKLGSAFTTENISLSSSGTDQTLISFSGNSDQITIEDQRAASPNGKIEFLQFADGFKADLLTYQSWIWGTGSGQTTAGSSGANTVFGRGGNDTINGNDGNDALHGGSGTDTVNGGNGDDQLHGGTGNDTLNGNAHNDFLFGGAGLDTLTGSTGADTFVFTADSAFSNIDVITDFSTAQSDKIDLTSLLSQYDPSTQPITDFVQITTSGSNSLLKIDVDGGANNFVQIAQLSSVTGLTDEAALVAAGHLIVPVENTAAPLYFEDFQSGATGWSSNITDNTQSAAFTQFLGRFGGDTTGQDTSKTFALSGDQSEVVVEFDFYRIDSWDWEDFEIYIDDTKILSQPFVDTEPSDDSGTFTGGTWERTTTAYGALGYGSSQWDPDGIFHYKLTLANSANTIKLGFGSTLDNSWLPDESWGVDNLEIYADAGGGGSTNTPPDAKDDAFSANHGVNITGNVLSNNGSGADSDADGGTLSVVQTSITSAQGSNVAMASNGAFTYYATPGFLGLDTFAYTLSDGQGGTDTATVSLTINAPAGAIVGTASAETLTGTSAADQIFGLGGADTISASSGNDTVYGGAGDDTLNGNSGDDVLYGGAGNDILYGNDNNDIFYGGDGLDHVYGGGGTDRFFFQKDTAFNNIDVVHEFFTSQGDKLNLSGILEGYNPATSAITDWIQITTSGADSILKVDVNGGGNSFVQIATIAGVTGLENEAALNASNNLIV